MNRAVNLSGGSAIPACWGSGVCRVHQREPVTASVRRCPAVTSRCPFLSTSRAESLGLRGSGSGVDMAHSVSPARLGLRSLPAFGRGRPHCPGGRGDEQGHHRPPRRASSEIRFVSPVDRGPRALEDEGPNLGWASPGFKGAAGSFALARQRISRRAGVHASASCWRRE